MSVLGVPYGSWESDFKPRAWLDYAKGHWEVPVISVIVYMIFCHAGSKVMANKQEFDLRMPLAMWNLALSLFSFMGMIRTVPKLLHNIATLPFEATICTTPTADWGTGAVGFWVTMFILSKIPELGDTIFIVLRKRPLRFLHWYHHVTVLLYCWHSFVTEAGCALYFVAMNYSVHAIMYGYYCLSALQLMPKWFPAHIITVGQIAQMFVGTGICTASWYYAMAGHPCANDRANLIAGGLMYASYFLLFLFYALERFIFPARTTKSKQASTKHLKKD